MRRSLEMSDRVKPHYKLEKTNSNFVLKFLFNAKAKKNQAEHVSLLNQKMRCCTGHERELRFEPLNKGAKMRLPPLSSTLRDGLKRHRLPKQPLRHRMIRPYRPGSRRPSGPRSWS